MRWVSRVGQVVEKCKVQDGGSDPCFDGWDILQDPLGSSHSDLTAIGTLPTHPDAVHTVPRPSQTAQDTIPAQPTSNTNSTGAFGITRWPKMRKKPYKTKFFAFLVFFLNSGFYMIV